MAAWPRSLRGIVKNFDTLFDHLETSRMVKFLFGLLCLFFSPGQAFAGEIMFEGYYRNDLHTHDDLDDQLSGNLCRCTGYRAIRDAAIEALSCRSSRGNEAQINSREKSEPPRVGCYEDQFAAHLKNTDANLGAANYESGGEKFLRPTSLAELLKLLKANPDGEKSTSAEAGPCWRGR